MNLEQGVYTKADKDIKNNNDSCRLSRLHKKDCIEKVRASFKNTTIAICWLNGYLSIIRKELSTSTSNGPLQQEGHSLHGSPHDCKG
ncbi:hypothetical protein V5799_003004 [Amblyomma americanum]|uniref:Uncharacterized protein n=1 Tax=Amblyomma americanum TaxID=6943 RepID=A0AAQ4DA75_AMBAM